MITRPESIGFNSYADVMNYVSKGAPPSQENFNKLMEGTKTTVTIEDAMRNRGRYVVVDKPIYLDVSEDELRNVVQLVYENSKRTQRNYMIASGILLAGQILLGISLAGAERRVNHLEMMMANSTNKID